MAQKKNKKEAPAKPAKRGSGNHIAPLVGVGWIARRASLPEKTVSAVLEMQLGLCEEALVTYGKCVVPGLVMLKTREKAATPEMTKNLFGKMVKIKAKPATKVVKATLAKKMRIIVEGF